MVLFYFFSFLLLYLTKNNLVDIEIKVVCVCDNYMFAIEIRKSFKRLNLIILNIPIAVSEQVSVYIV